MLIEEIMTKDVVTLTPSNTIEDAVRVMREHKIRHLPIITNNNEVVGIFTDRDFKNLIPSSPIEETNVNLYHTPLSEVMCQHVIIGHPMDFVEEAAITFYQNNIGTLPIVSNNKLVGIVTAKDLLYKYIELTGAHQPGSQIEVRVPDKPGILYEVAKVFQQQQSNVLSVLIYPDKGNEQYKILVVRFKNMNPLTIIEGLRAEGFEVLWPNTLGSRL